MLRSPDYKSCKSTLGLAFQKEYKQEESSVFPQMQVQLAKSVLFPSKTSQTSSVILSENTVSFAEKQKQDERPKTALWV